MVKRSYLPEMPFALVCSRCHHLASRHLGTAGDDANYSCAHCPCVMTSCDETYGIDERRTLDEHADEFAANEWARRTASFFRRRVSR